MSDLAFPNLEGHQFMSLVTFRASGEPVPTPVWFAEADGTLYVVTRAASGKVTRLRHTPRVTVAPCNRTGGDVGDPLPGVVRIIPADDPGAATPRAALDRKYGDDLRQVQARTPHLPRVYLAITRAQG